MDAPTELDRLIARHVMGWDPCPADWRPSSRWSDCRSVIDFIHQEIDAEETSETWIRGGSPGYITIQWTGEDWAVSHNYEAPDCWWDDPVDYPFTARDASLERACCLAALAVYGVGASDS